MDKTSAYAAKLTAEYSYLLLSKLFSERYKNVWYL